MMGTELGMGTKAEMETRANAGAPLNRDAEHGNSGPYDPPAQPRPGAAGALRGAAGYIACIGALAVLTVAALLLIRHAGRS